MMSECLDNRYGVPHYTEVIFTNAFSIQMLNHENAQVFNVNFEEVSPEEIIGHLSNTAAVLNSTIGHEDTAHVVSDILQKANTVGVALPTMFNRGFARLTPKTMLYVAQVVGGRLPEGSTTLPEGVEMKFFRVKKF